MRGFCFLAYRLGSASSIANFASLMQMKTRPALICEAVSWTIRVPGHVGRVLGADLAEPRLSRRTC